MGEERKKILNMVAEGKISVEEAEKLLNALKSEDVAVFSDEEIRNSSKELKYLRVVVDSKEGDNVNVRVPVALLRAGLKLSALIPPQAYQKMNEKMAQSGMDMDINALLKSGDIEQVIETMGELNVDVNSAQGDKVRVFFE
ncbi:MAG: SHOCT-like domain-containing protein [Chitinispirillaceae bacterium]